MIYTSTLMAVNEPFEIQWEPNPEKDAYDRYRYVIAKGQFIHGDCQSVLEHFLTNIFIEQARQEAQSPIETIGILSIN